MNNTFLKCRSCNSDLTVSFADLGEMPLANSYPPNLDAARNQSSHSLHVRICPHCFLAQADESEDVSEIFSEYHYFSSFSESWVEHARRFTVSARERFSLNQDSFVIEIASNDRYLLKHFVASNVPVLGVDPAGNVAQAAIDAGVPTLVAFFGTKTAQKLADQSKQADLIVANNVLAHTPYIRDFVEGLKIALKPGGAISIEFPHLLRLMNETQFDTIYHEHFSYLSLVAVEGLFERCGLRLFDVEELSTHGGSLRIFACHTEDARPECDGLHAVRTLEKDAGLDKIVTYADFMPKILNIREQLLAFLNTARDQGKKVVAYGAAAKGSTLMNFCGINRDLIAFAVDANPHKQGRLMPGSNLEIRPPEDLKAEKPDYILILPWNLSAEIATQIDYVHDWGCKMYAPIPELHEV